MKIPAAMRGKKVPLGSLNKAGKGVSHTVEPLKKFNRAAGASGKTSAQTAARQAKKASLYESAKKGKRSTAYGPSRKPSAGWRAGLATGTGREGIDAAEGISKSGKAFMAGVTGTEGGWKAIAGKAAVGAMAGGVAGASVNTLTGKDPWEGAKNGAIMGGVGYGGLHAVRAGVGAKAGESVGDAMSRFGQANNVSKDVNTLIRGQQAKAIVHKEVLSKKIKNR